MLSKVYKNNQFLVTGQIYKYNFNFDFDIIQDNLDGYLLIKKNDDKYLYNYKLNRIINYNRIPINFNNKIYWKQIESFDQNNILIANKIRNQVLTLINKYFNTDLNLIGIGGEAYIYFHFIKSPKYIFLTNNNYIFEDANFNVKYSKNYLVDYSNILKLNLKLEDNNNIIINISHININILNYIKNISKKIIIITCHLENNKLQILKNMFKIISFTHILNINSWITIIYLDNNKIK
jgi:hypothetical protein